MNTCTTERCGYAADGAPAMRNVRNQASTPMMDGTLIKLMSGEEYIEVRTYCRKFGESALFSINVERMLAWMGRGMRGTLHDKDKWSFLEMYHYNREVFFRFTWLRDSGSNLFGYEQTIHFPLDFVRELMAGNTAYTRMQMEQRTLPTFDFSRAGESLAYIIADPARKRAFCKEISRSFQWKRTESISFYNDSPKGSFFFRESGERGIVGGFILHTRETLHMGDYIAANKFAEMGVWNNGKYDASLVTHWCVHPLPLLTACGNDRGGGDFRQGGVGYEQVGIWAFDTLEYASVAPEGYQPVMFSFLEASHLDKVAANA